MKFIRLKLFMTYLKSVRDEYGISRNEKKIIVALAANYGNLGDVAITYAQVAFLKENFPECSVIEFNITDTFSKMKSLKKTISKQDIITIVGGGNLGNLYDDIEYSRQFIIKNFPENHIIIFPQSVYFSDDVEGFLKKQICKKIYGKHKKLCVFTREKRSYQICKEIFDNPVLLAPDIVMSMKFNVDQSDMKRKGVILCFRDDVENSVPIEYKRNIEERLGLKMKVEKHDTHVGKINDLTKLYEELQKLLEKFCSSELVITDRLHGMIFSYITNTPCIVFSGENHKIEGCYQWICDTNYIKMIRWNELPNILDFEKDVQCLIEVKGKKKVKTDLRHEFKILAQAVKGRNMHRYE